MLPLARRRRTPFSLASSSSTTRLFTATTATENNHNSNTISDTDRQYLQQAIDCGKRGLGHTFPNPAVGCVITQTTTTTPSSDHDRSTTTTTKVIGQGFHPRSGFPHAEVFSLLEAAGYVKDGCEAAESIVQANPSKSLLRLMQQYLEDPSQLFQDTFAVKDKQVEGSSSATTTTTAYVSLEPCCHLKKRTPPCAATFAMSRIDRVVIAYRDPNPAVNGGGVKVLQDAGVQVDILPSSSFADKTTMTMMTMHDDDDPLVLQARDVLMPNFIKRITAPPINYDESMNGAMRSALRTLANQKKASDILPIVEWDGLSLKDLEDDEDDEDDNKDGGDENESDTTTLILEKLVLPAQWMEDVDGLLWEHELVKLRLNTAVRKKKEAKLLAQRIASTLKAHVAQVSGKTCLLYRPTVPTPKLNLDELVAMERSKQKASKEAKAIKMKAKMELKKAKEEAQA